VPSIFSRIVAGEVPCHKVYEDRAHIAFLDVRPVQPGHVLVVPKHEVDYLFAMTAPEQAALWEAVARVEAGLRAATGCARVVVMVVGWEVPHVHVHLIPTRRASDVPFPPHGSLIGPEGMAARIRDAISAG